MLRLMILALAACLAAPAQAGYIYELGGIVTEVVNGDSVAGVIKVGDPFRATVEYFSSDTPSSNPLCFDDSASMISSFAFERASVSSMGQKVGGCVPRFGGPAFFLGTANGAGGLDGFGGHDGGIFLDFGSQLFPPEILDEVWLNGRISMLLFGPGGADNVKYSGNFTQVISRRIPEPATLGLFGIALLGLGWARRRAALKQ